MSEAVRNVVHEDYYLYWTSFDGPEDNQIKRMNNLFLLLLRKVFLGKYAYECNINSYLTNVIRLTIKFNVYITGLHNKTDVISSVEKIYLYKIIYDIQILKVNTLFVPSKLY